MAKYRKKPVVIEAIPFLPVETEMGRGYYEEQGVCFQDHLPSGLKLPHIHTLEGEMVVREGDWIITGVQGERYPCQDAIFQQTYEWVGA